jgi:hypothetical protein
MNPVTSIATADPEMDQPPAVEEEVDQQVELQWVEGLRVALEEARAALGYTACAWVGCAPQSSSA